MTEPASHLALIVDDSRSMRFALGKFLESLGFAVNSSPDPEAALSYLSARQTHVIFLDLDVEDVHFEALGFVRTQLAGAQIPIVLCASDDQPGLEAAALAHGADALMLKPPVRDELSTLLSRLIPSYVSPEQLPPIHGQPHDPEVITAEEPVTARIWDHSPTTPAAPAEESELEKEEEIWDDEPEAVAEEPAEELAADPDTEVEPIDDRAEELAELHAAQDLDIRQGIETLNPHSNADPVVDAAQPLAAPVEHIAVPAPVPVATALPTFTPAPAEPAAAVPDGRLLQLEARLRLLEQNMQSQLMELRMQLDLNLRAQIERIEQSRESIRAAVLREAQGVAERTVMAASEQLSDRLAESILKTLGHDE